MEPTKPKRTNEAAGGEPDRAAHGAERIQEWLDGLVERVRSGRAFSTSAGAEPDRDYAYLEVHDDTGHHSILLFSLSRDDEGVRIRSHHFVGAADEVRARVDEVVHRRDA